MEFLTKSIIGILIFSLIFISLFTITEHAQNKACQDIGYEEFKGTEEFKFCIDSDYNLHYVEWGYHNFPFDIWMKEISVGDVRVKNE